MSAPILRAALPALLLASLASAEFSPLASHLEAPGLPVAAAGARERALGEGGLAGVTGKSFTLANVSRSAFNEKTAFLATLEGDIDWLRDDDGNSSRLGSGTFPTLATLIKTKRFGTFGAFYQQTHHRRFEAVTAPGASPSKSWEFEGGLYLLGVSWAWAPVRWASLGVSQNFAIGRDRFIHAVEFGLPDGEDLAGDTLEIQREGSFPSVSATFRAGPVDFAASYTHSANLSTRAERRAGDMNTDSIADLAVLDLPKVFAVGAAWNLASRQMAVADFVYEDWEKRGVVNPAWQASVGYELRGTDSPFDGYFERASWRAGAGYKMLYLRETPEMFATLGAGLPLGPRGHVLDLALKYGHRRVEGLSSFTEDYVKLSASIVGVSVWGQPARRRR